MAIFTLLRKDLLIEVRSKETLASLLMLALLLAVVIGYGIQASFVSAAVARAVFPSLVWTIFLCGATISMGRSFQYEIEGRPLEAVLLSGVPAWQVYVSKVLGASILSWLSNALGFFVLLSLLNISPAGWWQSFIVLSLAVVFAYAALTALLSGIAMMSRLKGLLLPLLVLPLTFPIFACAIELTALLMEGQSQLVLKSSALTLLAGLDLVYLTVGILLYEHVVRE